MQKLASALLLGCLTTLALAWLVAAFMPVPMYPRRIFRVWLGENNLPASSSEVHAPGLHDIWWNTDSINIGDNSSMSNEEAVEKVRARFKKMEAERRGKPNAMRYRPGSPAWGTFASGPGPGTKETGSDTAFGFPLPCLWYSVRGEVKTTPQSVTLTNEHIVGGLVIAGEPSARLRNFHALPLLPIWPRLLGNIAFWSLVWWLVPTALIAWRRQRRSRRGLCQGCGYDLAGIAVGEDERTVCPECGTAWKLGEAPASQSPALEETRERGG